MQIDQDYGNANTCNYFYVCTVTQLHMRKRKSDGSDPKTKKVKHPSWESAAEKRIRTLVDILMGAGEITTGTIIEAIRLVSAISDLSNFSKYLSKYACTIEQERRDLEEEIATMQYEHIRSNPTVNWQDSPGGDAIRRKLSDYNRKHHQIITSTICIKFIKKEQKSRSAKMLVCCLKRRKTSKLVTAMILKAFVN